MTATAGAASASLAKTGPHAVSAARTALFTPLQIGKHIELPNRFVMQPMYLNMESEMQLLSKPHMEAMATFFAERAHYGAKLIIVGGLGISRFGAWKKDALNLNTVDAAKALSAVTRAVHQENGYVLAQAFHAGRSANKPRFFSSTSQPSKVQLFKTARPFRVPAFMVQYIVSEYQRFARLAEDAGFDGVEIPVSEGTLLHNFLSPAVNTRTDAFGGSLEKRLEFTIRVLESVKANVVNKDRFVVSLRLCLHDLRVGGTPMQETLQVAEVLSRSGYIDVLNTSVGMHDSPVQTLAANVPMGTFARACQLVKQRLRDEKIAIPVIASHRIHSLAVAERLMERGVCDLIGVARPLLADPQFILKAEQHRDEEVLPCIGCNHCVDRLYKQQRMTCALNPISGFELEKGWLPSKYQKSIAVIGAGPAGVSCALTLWRRGHDVTLFEKESVIGGQLDLAKRVPGKEAYQAVLEHWTRLLRNSSINVRLNSEFTREEVARNHQFFHSIVLTTGSQPKPVSSHIFPGASESKLIVPFRRILDGSVTAGRRVVILGNGAIAHDVASFLLHDQRVSRSIDYFLDEFGVNLEDGSMLSPDVAAERAPRNNRDVVLMNKSEKDADLSRGWGWSQKLWIQQHGATILKHAVIELIDQDGVHISILQPDNRKFVIPCDTIVWCVGMLPDMKIGTWIHEWAHDGAKSRGEMITDFGIYMAGSCRDAFSGDGHGEQDMLQAIHEGYDIGYKV